MFGEERELAKQITCECGTVIRGESDDEVVAGAESHMRQDHAELVGQVSREDLLSWIEESRRHGAGERSRPRSARQAQIVRPLPAVHLAARHALNNAPSANHSP
jgi:hypothetical protein